MTVIVLLPGMDGSGRLFDDFVSALGLKTIIVTYPPDRVLTYEQLESVVDKELPVDEPYILLGESFSGPIAIGLAAKKSPALRAVVLVCTFAKLRRKPPPHFLPTLLALFPFWKLPVYVGAAALFGRFNSAAIRSKLAVAIRGVSPDVWRSRLRSVLEVDVTTQLQRIQVPVLYLRATEDRVVPAAASELILRINARVKVVAIEGPHALLQTNPNACASAVRAFAHDMSIVL